MPALPMAKYGLESLYLFPYYQSREDYQKATGADAPVFNPNRQPKYWQDPKAKDSLKRNVVYNQVLAIAENGAPLVGADGKPMLDLLLLQKDEAATVNIPVGAANVVGADVPAVPPPLRALESNEELDFGFGNTVYVHNTDYPFDDTGIFSAADRLLLKAIAKKLGV
jgi:hypothetical protein